MKGFASITLAIRIGISVIVLVAVWYTMHDYVETMKNIEMMNKMQDVAEYMDAKVLYALKMTQSSDYSYLKDKFTLPDYREDYVTSISCGSDNLLAVNASIPVRGIYFSIKDYINCSNMDISGSLIPGGERCIFANRTGAAIKITLVNYCGSV